MIAHHRHVQVHDAESGSPIVALAGHSGAVHVLAHSPDRKRFATAGADRSVRIWETGSAEPVSERGLLFERDRSPRGWRVTHNTRVH